MQKVLIAIFLFAAVTANSQDSLVARSFLNNRIQLQVPKSFSELSQKVIANRFPDPETRPFVILSDKEEYASLKIIKMPLDVSDSEVGQYKSFHLSNMRKESNLKFQGDGVKMINGKKVGFIKVIYPERNVFAYYFFTSMDGKLLLLTYNCADKLWPALEEKAEAIVQSLKVE